MAYKEILIGIGLFLTSAALASDPNKVALVIQFGDGGDGTTGPFADTTKHTLEVYAKLGYTVRLVTPGPHLRERLRNEFRSLESASEITVVTSGHGTNSAQTSATPSYPTQRLNPSMPVLDTGFFQAPRSKGTFIFENYAPTSQGSDFGSIGVGDFKDWIQSLHKKSPETRVTFSITECYGGLAARALNQIDGVNAFSATSDIESAGFKSIGNRNFAMFNDVYLDEVVLANHESPKPNELDIFERARKKWVNETSANSTMEANVPWSPIDSYIVDWCITNDKNLPLNPDPLSPALQDAKSKSDLTVNDYTTMGERLQRQLGCADREKQAAVDETISQIQELSIQANDNAARKLEKLTYKDFLAKKSKSLKPMNEKSFINYRQRAVSCLRTNPTPSAPCLDELKQDSMMDLPDGGFHDFSQCSQLAWEEGKCLNYLSQNKERYPGHFLQNLWRASTNLNMFKFCSENRRANDYRSCYRRFWQQADFKSRKNLEGRIHAFAFDRVKEKKRNAGTP